MASRFSATFSLRRRRLFLVITPLSTQARLSASRRRFAIFRHTPRAYADCAHGLIVYSESAMPEPRHFRRYHQFAKISFAKTDSLIRHICFGRKSISTDVCRESRQPVAARLISGRRYFYVAPLHITEWSSNILADHFIARFSIQRFSLPSRFTAVTTPEPRQRRCAWRLASYHDCHFSSAAWRRCYSPALVTHGCPPPPPTEACRSRPCHYAAVAAYLQADNRPQHSSRFEYGFRRRRPRHAARPA